MPRDKVSEQEDEFTNWLLGRACGEGGAEELPAKEVSARITSWHRMDGGADDAPSI